MTFGEKLKDLRIGQKLTQDELAERVYVTRTAVSKWENGRGFPAIDSLRLLAKTFGITIDELVSEEVVGEKRDLDRRIRRRCYLAAIACLALAVLFSLLAYFLRIPLLNIGSAAAVAGYVLLGFLSRPKDRRLPSGAYLWTYLGFRLVLLLFVIGVAVATIIQMR